MNLLLGPILRGGVLCLALAWLQLCLPAAAQAAGMVLHEAQFTRLDAAALDSPELVSLPDTWGQRKIGTTGRGRYELRFTLDALPDLPYGLSMTRVSSTRRIFLNGRLIDDTTSLGYMHPVRAVISLPPLLLRTGENELAIEVEHRVQGGLSQMKLGPAAELRGEEAHRALLVAELPRSLNMGMTLLAVFLLLVRWRRPSERAMGLFGALALLGSVRNYSYFMQVSLLPVGVGDVFYFAAQVWTILLFAAFALSLHTQRPRNGVDRLIVVAAIAVPLVGAVTSPFGGLTVLRTVVYPFLLLAGVLSLGVIWRAMRQDRSAMNVALVAGFAVLMLSGGHDYLFQQGHLPVTHFYWVPFAMPLAFGVYGLLQMNRFVVAMNDVEQLNQELEHRVQQRTRALQSANATKTRFIASASHDLRQPVAAIGLMVGLLREQIAVPRLQAMIDRVDEAVASMESMLKGLLDLSRLESGTVQPRLQRVVLQSLFDAIAVHEGEAAAAKGVRLRFRPTRLVAQSDPVLLEQIVRNLVSNAVRYTERGGVLVAARARGEGQVLLQVWDSGIGIPPEHHVSVFDEFVQLDNAARQRTRGFGLGLSIVKRSADVLGHGITLRSRTGLGSCFSVLVGRGVSERRARPRHLASGQPLAGLRMVLVEDDAGVRESLSARLQAWGATVQAYDSVPTLRAALPLAGSPKDGRFTDLLITDQRLPGGSGLLVIELVRQRCGATRAMVVTGDTAPGDLASLAGSGVPVLHKPFRAEELLATIRRALLQNGAVQETPP